MLARGSRLGPYEVLEPIGSGGMGEVFRARDGPLGRDVAIKILSERFRLDSQRLARFEREARVLASLNHPNIATLHAVEASGDTQALVLELVEGETLSERIARGAIPSPMRSRSRARSRPRSRQRTSREWFIGISSRRTSSFGRTEE